MNGGKRYWLALVLALLFVGPLCSGSTKAAYGTATQLLSEWKLRIANLIADSQAYREQLTASRARLVALQSRLVKLQTELEESSRDLTISRESLENLQTLLSTLKASFLAETLKARRLQIITGIIAAVTGAALGLIVGALALAR